MKLDAEFYQNLLKSLTQQAGTNPPHPKGWGGAPELIDSMKKLLEEASARHIFIIERTGKQSASYGDLGQTDITDLVALVVGKVLACDALATLVNGSPFLSMSIEGRRWGAHFSALGKKAILMVVFDHQTNIDLVGLRVRRASNVLLEALTIAQQLEKPAQSRI